MQVLSAVARCLPAAGIFATISEPYRQGIEYLLVTATANSLGCRHLFATLLLMASDVEPLAVSLRYFV